MPGAPRTTGKRSDFNEAWRNIVGRACEAHGWTQPELAEELGVSRNAVQAAMRLPSQVKWSVAEACCELASVTADERDKIMDAWCRERNSGGRMGPWYEVTESALALLMDEKQAKRLRRQRVEAQRAAELEREGLA